VVDRTLLIANREEAIQLSIDTVARRRPSLEVNPRFQTLRSAQKNGSLVFGYFSTQGISQILKEARRASKNATPQRQLLSGFGGLVLTTLDFSVAYEMHVEAGLMVEQYYLEEPPERRLDLTENLKVPESDLQSLKLIPGGIKGFTILRCSDPSQTVDFLVKTLTHRLSTVSRAAVEGIVPQVKRSLGLSPDDTILDALGGELAIIEGDHPGLLFIASVKKQAKLAALVGKYLQHDGAKVLQTQYHGFDIYSSSDQRRQSFCFLDEHLLAGSPALIQQVIDALLSQATLIHDLNVMAMIQQAPPGAFEISMRFDREGHARIIQDFATWLTRSGHTSQTIDPTRLRALLESLPPTIRSSRSSSQGIYTETRSPLGEFLSVLSWIEATDEIEH
jgi:hypothetical protein